MRNLIVFLLSLSHALPDGFEELSPPVQQQPYASSAKTAGPSGTLVQPKGGAVFKNHVGAVGNVEVIYRGVSDGNDVGARTCTIDLHLLPVSKASQTKSFNLARSDAIHLSYGLRPHDSGSSQPIWANFVPLPEPVAIFTRSRCFLKFRSSRLREATLQSAAMIFYFLSKWLDARRAQAGR
ncbi:hypothetical protein H4Q26_000705 [Puccinia striiformis f. sp. tritici PST-130]|nr:hypothetical protein H4Q26_000705 [Puccinia striiformis f. sp. tritici PST-130]